MTNLTIWCSSRTLLLIAVASAIVAAQPSKRPAVPAKNLSPYHIVHDWPIVPDNTMLDEVSAVGVDSYGNVFVLMRGGRKWPDSGAMDQTPIPVPTVYVFDGKTGRFITKWGEKVMALPHGLTVDSKECLDNRRGPTAGFQVFTRRKITSNRRGKGGGWGRQRSFQPAKRRCDSKRRLLLC